MTPLLAFAALALAVLHGNGALWARLPTDGVYAGRHDEQPLFVKMLWPARAGSSLDVRYARLDVPGRRVGAETIRGTWGAYAGPSWSSRLYLDEGCWKIVGRVRDVTLSFVLKVTPP